MGLEVAVRSMGLAGWLVFPGLALAQSQTDEVGGTGGQGFGSASYKLDVFDVGTAVQLDGIEFWLEPAANGAEAWFVVYRDNGPNAWDLVWDSGAVAISAGGGFKSAGAVGTVLVPGNQYAIGVFLPGGNDMGYRFGDVGGQNLGWAIVDAAVFSSNGQVGGNSPPANLQFPQVSNSPYNLRVTVSFGSDEDGDGVGVGDCNDADPTIYPGAGEACDGVDNDCDGTVDEDVVFRDVYADADGDGYGDPAGEVQSVCEAVPPAGFADQAGDCDDGDAGVNPAAQEVCDGKDTNCDGSLGSDEQWDGDGDGSPSCIDCDDDDAGVFPGQEEICNGLDNDCDGEPAGPEICDPLENGEGLSIAGACGCATGSGPAAAWWVLPLAVVARRRRTMISR